jgi:hypothetical protein
MTTPFRRLIALATAPLLALSIAACGSSAAPSGSTPVTSSAPSNAAPSSDASAAASPSAAATASEVASAPASAGASAPGGSLGIPSFHEAPDLEAALPDQVGGVALQKLSFKGSGSLAGGTDSQDFQNLLGAIGKSPDDFSLAVAAGQNVSVGVFRVAGTDGNVLLTAFIEAAKKGDATTQVSDANRGGKSVRKVVTGTDTTYAYANGDKVFFVQSETDALVDEALSKLP